MSKRARTFSRFFTPALAVAVAVSTPVASAQALPNVGSVTSDNVKAPKVYTAAIFIKNRAKQVDAEKVAVLEDLVTSRLTDQGFNVLSRDEVIKAVSAFDLKDPNVPNDVNNQGAKMDAALANNTTALRLAQNMNADYLLVASITTFGTNTFNNNALGTQVTETTMRVSYKLLDGVMGGSLTGDTIEVGDKEIATADGNVQKDLVNTLLDKASVKLADQLGAKLAANKIREAPAGAKMTDLTIECSMADLAIPEIRKDKDGNYNIEANKYRIEAMSVTVEIDGIAIGSAPGTWEVAPGLHKVRLKRELCEDLEATINVKPGGFTWRPALKLSGDGYARWRQNIQFLEEMRDKAKKSDAEVKQIEAIAQMFSQSGFRVDSRSDVRKDEVKNSNVDIKGDSIWPKYEINQMGGPPGRDGRDGRDAAPVEKDNGGKENGNPAPTQKPAELRTFD